MAKKKITSRVSPAIALKPVGVSYENLNDGDCFIYQKKLFIKMDIMDQEAISLDGNREWETNMCDKVIIPVDVKITWKVKN